MTRMDFRDVSVHSVRSHYDGSMDFTKVPILFTLLLKASSLSEPQSPNGSAAFSIGAHANNAHAASPA